jgi:hypothetical protein
MDSIMMNEHLQARAVQRARDLNTHIMRVRGRPGVYTCTSSEDKQRKYSLVARNGIEACSCDGFAYRQSCRHVEALRNRLGRELPHRGRRGLLPDSNASSYSLNLNTEPILLSAAASRAA